MNKKTTCYLVNETNSTLFTRCCDCAVNETYDHGVQNCPRCGAEVEGEYRWVWSRAFRESMGPKRRAEHEAHCARMVAKDRDWRQMLLDQMVARRDARIAELEAALKEEA